MREVASPNTKGGSCRLLFCFLKHDCSVTASQSAACTWREQSTDDIHFFCQLRLG